MFTNNKFAKMDSIANLINTILETDTKSKMEELKGKQHKIDKNKNNKIDAQDFKILRGEKKVEESSHQAKTTMKHIPNPTAGEKKAAKDIKPGVAGYRDRIAMLKSAEARGGLKKEESEVNEAKEPGFRSSYGLGKKDATAKKPETYGKRVQGKGYDKPENERKAPEGNVAMTSLMPGHDERAAKFLARQAKGKLVKGKAQSATQKEEIDPKKTTVDTLKGREMDSKNPNLSKKVLMDVPGNVKEESEQIDEKAKWRSSSAAEPNPEHDPDEYAHDKLSTGSPIRSKANKPLSYGSIQSRRGTEVATSGARKGMITKKSAESLKNRIKANLNKEEVEQIDERSLTAPETAEKERIVKGMKKSLAGFKSRYGDRAKSVMYATATKAAKERK